MTTASPMLWLFFNSAIVLLLILDACYLTPKDKEISMKRALGLSAFWIILALAFNGGVYYYLGKQSALEFLTGYVIEQSLSVDNLFVFLLIFAYFKVFPANQRKALFWGVLGAQVMRAIFILLGVALLHRFHWIIYFFGAFLIFSGIKLFVEKDKEVHPEHNPLLKLLRIPATSLLAVIIVIETTDLIFALDSIPAVLAVTKDPFIAYSSNIFAILGLRAMYFALAGLMAMFHHLHYGLGVVLTFVGFKMFTDDWWPMPIAVALGVIMVVLIVSIISSIYCPKPKDA